MRELVLIFNDMSETILEAKIYREVRQTFWHLNTKKQKKKSDSALVISFKHIQFQILKMFKLAGLYIYLQVVSKVLKFPNLLKLNPKWAGLFKGLHGMPEKL